jgi:membrane protease YdiL (CAAX protease family)
LKKSSRARFAFILLAYFCLLLLFWVAAIKYGVLTGTPLQVATTFASFALLFGAYFAFGAGLDEWCGRNLNNLPARLTAPTLVSVPYLLYSLPRHEFLLRFFLLFILLPVAIAALLYWQKERERAESRPPAFSAIDFIVLLTAAALISQRMLADSFPHPGLSSLPKMLVLVAALYGYLVVRELQGVGFDWNPHSRDFAVGAREYFFFLPFALAIGLSTGFIGFHSDIRQPALVIPLALSTFFFVAVPEELFFRGILQNLLRARFGARPALLMTSVLFGLSHFNKLGSSFNWRYVCLASIAGFFYGRAWQDRGRILTSALTHAAVDVTWSLWFR